MQYFKKYVAGVVLAVCFTTSSFAGESQDVKDLRKQISALYDKWFELIVKPVDNDTKPDNHNKKDCDCKGTGFITHGDGHRTKCPCDKCGCNTRGDEPVEQLKVEAEAKPAPIVVPVPKVVAAQKEKVVSQLQNAIYMVGSVTCGPCRDWERLNMPSLVKQQWPVEALKVEVNKDANRIRQLKLPAPRVYPTFHIFINGEHYIHEGFLTHGALRGYIDGKIK